MAKWLSDQLDDGGWTRVWKGPRLKYVLKGWKVYTKRFGATTVQADVSTWPEQAFLSVSVPKGLDYDAELWEQLRGSVDYDAGSLETVEALAKHLVARRRELTPGRKRKSVDEYEWWGRTGQDAVDAWATETRREVVNFLRGRRIRAEKEAEWGVHKTKPWVEAHAMYWIVDSASSGRPRGMSKKSAQSRLRKLLDKWAAAGDFEKIPAGHAGPKVMWAAWPKGEGPEKNPCLPCAIALGNPKRKANPQKKRGGVNALVRKALK